MASLLPSKARAASKLLEKLLFSTARPLAVPSASTPIRSFTASAQPRQLDDGHGDDDRSLSHRSRTDPFPSFFSDVFEPFYPPRTLSQLLNVVDHLTDGQAAGGRGIGRRGWDAKEDADGLYLRMDMPGLGKEDVKVTVEQNTLVIKGEESGDKDVGGEDGARGKYSSRIELPGKVYRSEQIRAEMKNGVLKVFVPKVKEEERKDVVQISVE